jgi:two-component system sensor histidine kinase MprB
VSFRARLTLAAAAAVALAVVLSSAVVYVVVRDQLRGTVDDGLRDRAAEISQEPVDRVFFTSPFANLYYVQLVSSDGACSSARGGSCGIPVAGAALKVARSGRGTYISDARVSGTHLRMLTFPYAPGYAVQVARPMSDIDRSLTHPQLPARDRCLRRRSGGGTRPRGVARSACAGAPTY